MLLDDKTRQQIKAKFDAELTNDVYIRLFSTGLITAAGDDSKEYVEFTKEFLRELTELNDRIHVEFDDMYGEEAKKRDISVSPSVIIGDGNGWYPVQYFGAPAGYEASSFIEAISMISNRDSGLDTSSKEKLRNIDRDLLIETYVTPGCPHCPRAVVLSNQIAIESGGKIVSRCVEAQEMMDRARLFNVSSVPQQVINEERGSITVGVQRESAFVNQVLEYGSSRAKEILEKEEEERKRKETLNDVPDSPVVITDNNIDEAIAKYPFLVVDCWAEWCMPCKMIGPVIEKLAVSQKGAVVFGKLDVDGNPDSSARFNIRSIPNLLVFRHGEKVGDIIGAMPEDVLLEKINAYR
ncbi:MAG: thioredoxin [Deltaproteobacteria bacterium]|nr:thioredoxin [Deltaproteobacteria bacterium]